MNRTPIDRRSALRSLAIGGAAVLVSPSFAEAAEVEVSKVPPAVREAADRLFKGAKWSRAHKGKTSFELDGKDAGGRVVSVEVTADGKVRGAERQVTIKEVPARVMKALTDRFPKFAADAVYEVFSGTDIRELAKAELAFEFEGAVGKKDESVVTISAEGKILAVELEIEMKAVPKVVADALKKAEPKFRPHSVHKIEEDGVSGYLFAGDFRKEKRETVVFVSADGKDVEAHTDDE